MLSHIFQKSTGAIKKSSRQRAGGRNELARGRPLCLGAGCCKKIAYCTVLFCWRILFRWMLYKKSPFRGMMATVEKKEYISMFSKNLNSHKATSASSKEVRRGICSGRKIGCADIGLWARPHFTAGRLRPSSGSLRLLAGWQVNRTNQHAGHNIDALGMPARDEHLWLLGCVNLVI